MIRELKHPTKAYQRANPEERIMLSALLLLYLSIPCRTCQVEHFALELGNTYFCTLSLLVKLHKSEKVMQ